jgi:class 3 adenylate cyclase
MTTTQRKLTTIFSADVQDYTRLMGADEEGTVATLKRYRDAMSRLIEAHGGRLINTWGDGLIAEFPSVVEAVRTAVDVQNELAGLNAVRPADGRMLYRIGINLGDVIVEGDDIYGDGVNIAARLQATAAAGGIVISNTVYDQVRNKVAVHFDFLGPLKVKNVEDAIPSYAVRLGEGSGRTREPTAEVPHRAQATPARLERAGMPLAVIAVAIVAVNVLTWHGKFWAAWPVLAFTFVWAMMWASRQTRVDSRFASLAVVGLFIVGINLLSWGGTFWAIWPLLVIAVVVGLGWVRRI